MILNDSMDQNLVDLLQLQNGIRLDSDISIFTSNGLITDLYKIDNARNEDAKIVMIPNGHWNASGIHNYDASVFKVPNRMNLKGIRLDAVLYVS